MTQSERKIETVQEVNMLFEHFDFKTVRDVLERGGGDQIEREIPEVSEYFFARIDPAIKVEFCTEQALAEGSEFPSGQSWIEMWRAWLAAFDTYQVEAGNYEAVGDQVIADVVNRGIGRASGLEIEMRQAQLWSFRGSRLARLRVYDRLEQAREAAEAER
jgi:hypothetical protein